MYIYSTYGSIGHIVSYSCHFTVRHQQQQTTDETHIRSGTRMEDELKKKGCTWKFERHKYEKTHTSHPFLLTIYVGTHIHTHAQTYMTMGYIWVAQYKFGILFILTHIIRHDFIFGHIQKNVCVITEEIVQRVSQSVSRKNAFNQRINEHVIHKFSELFRLWMFVPLSNHLNINVIFIFYVWLKKKHTQFM